MIFLRHCTGEDKTRSLFHAVPHGVPKMEYPLPFEVISGFVTKFQDGSQLNCNNQRSKKLEIDKGMYI